jgi:DNA mismatch endonuclease, patch repair protein
MASVPTTNSKPEVRLRKELFRLGYRYRLHVKSLPGTPDIVMPKHRSIVFVHGCFWHRHPGCRLSSIPATRSAFWASKFNANVARDRRNRDALRKLGWNIVIMWQCEVDRSVQIAAERVAKRLSRFMTKISLTTMNSE